MILRQMTIDGAKPVIGLTGAIGSGKSTVAGFLSAQKFGIVDCDKVSANILSTISASILAPIFGWNVVRPSGEIDKKRIADMIFTDAAIYKKFMDLMISPIFHKMFSRCLDFYCDDKVRGIVVNAPLLVEYSHQFSFCDGWILVDCPLPLRLDRVVKNRGWKEEELHRRERFMLPMVIKRSIVDYIVWNDGGMDKCEEQVKRFLEGWKQK